MTTDNTSGTEGVPEWDPFSSDDPHIKFLIATIVTSAIVLTEDPTAAPAMRTMLMAAASLRDAVHERMPK